MGKYHLTDRESFVIKHRGHLGAKPRTLEEVGRPLQVTRERIRQIESKGMRKMCKMIKMGELKDLRSELNRIYRTSQNIYENPELLTKAKGAEK